MARGNPNPSPATRFGGPKAPAANPAARRPGATLSALLREALEADETVYVPGKGKARGARKPTGRTRGQALVEAAVAGALEGDKALIMFIFERVDGRVPVKVTADEGATGQVDPKAAAAALEALAGGHGPSHG